MTAGQVNVGACVGSGPGRSGVERLDADVSGLLGELDRRGVGISGPTDPDVVRRHFTDLQALLHPDPPPPFSGVIEDRLVDMAGLSVPVRWYEPAGARPEDGVLVFAHGGGWVSGDLDTADWHVRRTAELLGAVVVSVGYRKSPEHPYPAPLADLLAVQRWVADRLAPRWLGVGGDSAGGNLAAAAAHVAARYGVRCDAQLLVYPALDPLMNSGSHREFATGYLLEATAMRWYWQCYQGSSVPPEHPLLAPLWSTAHALSTVAPAVVATAGFDPLRDEGREYAQRLHDSGVRTVHIEDPGLVHGWLDQLDRVAAARTAHGNVIDAFASLVRHISSGSGVDRTEGEK